MSHNRGKLLVGGQVGTRTPVPGVASSDKSTFVPLAKSTSEATTITDYYMPVCEQ